MRFHHDFSVRRAKGQFHLTLSLHLHSERIIDLRRSSDYDEGILELQDAGRFVPRPLIFRRMRQDHRVPPVAEHRIPRPNRPFRSDGIEKHWNEERHGDRKADGPQGGPGPRQAMAVCAGVHGYL